MAVRARKPKRSNPKQTIFTRFTLIVAFLVLWMCGITVRLVHLQVNQHEWLAERAEKQRQDVKRSKMPRGTIFDRDGHALAMSVTVKTLIADPVMIEDTKAAAKSISKVVGVKESDLEKKLKAAKEDGKRYMPIIKDLDEEAAQKINMALEDSAVRKDDLPKFLGLHWKEGQKRSYPYESLAAHIVGFSNNDGVGQAGIEQSQNKILFGSVIDRLQERDRLGRVYDETVSEKEPPKDVVLTISTATQYFAEQAVERAVRSANARSGMAIVMDHKTGEILAMANYPTFDPNKLGEITADTLPNAAVQSVYSPGSAFKLITYSSALERHLITPDQEIDSGNGTIEVAKHVFRDSHSIGRVTYAKALAHSSNVCAIKTSLRVGKEGFNETMRAFGFGRPTGIELPAETGGIVRPIDKWNGDSLASMSIGYEIGVSALQMATAFATIANNGVRVQPHIIKEIRQSDDQVVSAARPDSVRVVGEDTARDLRRMLEQVVLDGTGRRARLKGYTSAGKTGTAWKFDPQLKKVNSAKYVSSFIGFAPVDDPAVTIAVVIDEPKVGGRDGGQVAAPAFREIAEQVLPEMNVKPDGLVAEQRSDEAIPVETADGGIEVPETILTTAPNPESILAIKDSKPHSEGAEPSRPSAVVKKPIKDDVRSQIEKPKKVPKDKPVPEATKKEPTRNKASTDSKKGKT